MKEKDYVDQEEKELDKWFEKFFSDGMIVGYVSAEEALERGLTKVDLTPEEEERYYSEVEDHGVETDETFLRLAKEAKEGKEGRG